MATKRPTPVTDDLVADYLAGPPYTIGTFLTRRLRGAAKQYSGRYAERMVAALRARGAVSVPSVSGLGTAYRLPAPTRSLDDRIRAGVEALVSAGYGIRTGLAPGRWYLVPPGADQTAGYVTTVDLASDCPACERVDRDRPAVVAILRSAAVRA